MNLSNYVSLQVLRYMCYMHSIYMYLAITAESIKTFMTYYLLPTTFSHIIYHTNDAHVGGALGTLVEKVESRLWTAWRARC